MNRDLAKALVPNNRELKEHLINTHKLMSRRLASEMPTDHGAPAWLTFAAWTEALREETRCWVDKAGEVDWPSKRQLVMMYLQEALAIHLEITKEEVGSPSPHTEPVTYEGG